MKQFLVLLVGVLTLVVATPKFQQCASNPVVRLEVSRFPDVLELKSGKVLNVAFKVTVLQDLQEPIYARIKLKRKLWFVWATIPCINNVGSCEVKLTCDKIREWSKLEKLPHPCPAPAGVTERQFTITIPDVHPAVKAVGSGRYQAEVSLYTGPDKRGRHLGCAKTELEVRT